MKKILFLSFFFEPDLSACSFRNSPLAFELANLSKGKAEIIVATTKPNRYSNFKPTIIDNNLIHNLKIHRIKLNSDGNSILKQIKNFIQYYNFVLKLTNSQDYDLVYASSSKLFTAYLGYRISKKKQIPLYLDIRDIFIDTIKDVYTSNFFKLTVLFILKKVEKKVFNNANHINLISEGFKSYFSKFKNKNYTYFTNGIDSDFILNDNYKNNLNTSKIIITYAGNIGEGQGIHKIIPQAAKILGEKYIFNIYGDGSARGLLTDNVINLNLNNVFIHDPINRIELIDVYKSSHYLFIHLNNYSAFQKVLPSKIFELGSFPRPIIAGVSGYSKLFMQAHLTEVILFEPANSDDLVSQLIAHNFVIPNRAEFINKFQRKTINIELSKSIISYI